MKQSFLARSGWLAALVCGAALVSTAQAAETNRFSHFDGIWNKTRGSLRYSQNPPFTPAAQAAFDGLRPQDDPGSRCVESGTPRIMITPYPMEIIGRDNYILLVSEFNHVVRRIWTDTKEHDPDADPSYYGDTVVHWEGDVMVVDSVNFNALNYLDPAGDPMSTRMRLVERWQLTDSDTLQIEFTFDDPEHYTRPWTSVQTYKRQPKGFKLGEFSCTENNRNNPDDPNNPKSLTSTDTPQPYERKRPQ